MSERKRHVFIEFRCFFFAFSFLALLKNFVYFFRSFTFRKISDLNKCFLKTPTGKLENVENEKTTTNNSTPSYQRPTDPKRICTDAASLKTPSADAFSKLEKLENGKFTNFYTPSYKIPTDPKQLRTDAVGKIIETNSIVTRLNKFDNFSQTM